jgi:hypothetical protein
MQSDLGIACLRAGKFEVGHLLRFFVFSAWSSLKVKQAVVQRARDFPRDDGDKAADDVIIDVSTLLAARS